MLDRVCHEVEHYFPEKEREGGRGEEEQKEDGRGGKRRRKGE